MRRNYILAKFILFISIVILSSCRSSKQQVSFDSITHPKREFRGAWLNTAWQSRYMDMNSQQMQEYFVLTLDKLQSYGINAVIFQVRPQADAFYNSDIEPWSALLTGKQGKAPDNNFDPLKFLTEECHKRGMELHAWLNPYRVTLNENDNLNFSPQHIYFREPERFVTYGGKIYFDPGIPSNKKYICHLVKDIVSRYNIDAIHMDDYFYPYPIPGISFPDNDSFNKYGKALGFEDNQRDTWRRHNVNTLIKEIKFTIASVKPWVRFGISPFGIYRNQKNTLDDSGSDTNGLQNYDDLYADVLLWIKEGWIDYNMPQIYWEIGHSGADYDILVRWWAQNIYDRPLYIGQDAKRTMDAVMPSGNSQLLEKMILSRTFPTIQGSGFWSAYELLDNYKEISNELKNNYYRYPALIPPYTHMHNKQPKKIDNLTETYTPNSHTLSWTSDTKELNPETAQYYVIYRFTKSEKIDLNNSKNIVKITNEREYVLPYEGGKNEYKYVVTSVDAFHNESKGKTIKIKL